MRTWTVAQGPVGRSGKGFEVCGHCSRQIANGSPVQIITLTGIARRFLRCEECASGPVNEAEVDAARLAIEAREAELAAAPPTLSTWRADVKPPAMVPLADLAGTLFDDLKDKRR